MNYIGKGIYTYTEASLITGVKSYTLRRWIEGYSRNKTNQKISPIFPSDFDKIEAKKALSFMDVIEILFIKAFHGYGLSLQTIREAVERASLLLATNHPFAIKKFYTDGNTILARIAKESDLPQLIDLIKKQYQFDEIVLPELYECIDFDKYDIAERYWPEGKGKNIIIDPKINLGNPSLFGSNVPIKTINDLYNSGQTITELSEWYDIDKKDIEIAINFENKNVA